MKLFGERWEWYDVLFLCWILLPFTPAFFIAWIWDHTVGAWRHRRLIREINAYRRNRKANQPV